MLRHFALRVTLGGSGYRFAGFWAGLGHFGNVMGRFGNGLGTLESAGMYLWRPERALGSLRGVRVRSGKLWGRSGDAQEAAWNAQNDVKYDVLAV